MLTEKEKLESLTILGLELNSIHDLDILMEKVLLRARQFVNADAGSIYICEDDQLHFAYTQNDTLEQNLEPGGKLIYENFSIPIDTKTIAGYVATTGSALNIADVYEIGAESPYGFGRQYDEASGYVSRSMLTIPLKTSKGEILGILQIINAQDDSGTVRTFSKDDEKVMRHFAGIASVALERAKMTRAMILRMIRMAEMRDPSETGAHVNRVACFSVEIYEEWARRRNFDEKSIDRTRDILRMAAMLHDVGKVATSDLILKKPSKLDTDEFEIMKQHTIQGRLLFLDIQSDYDEAAGIIALNHHEKWDGSGYPGHVDPQTGAPLPGFALPDGSARGKKGEEIHSLGRIVALADVYDALSSRRSYKEPWDETRSLEFISSASGAHFDPELVDIFLNRMDIIRSIQTRYVDQAEQS